MHLNLIKVFSLFRARKRHRTKNCIQHTNYYLYMYFTRYSYLHLKCLLYFMNMLYLFCVCVLYF